MGKTRETVLFGDRKSQGVSTGYERKTRKDKKPPQEKNLGTGCSDARGASEPCIKRGKGSKKGIRGSNTTTSWKERRLKREKGKIPVRLGGGE